MKVNNQELKNIQDKIEKCQKCKNAGFVLCGNAPQIYYETEDIKVMIIGHSPATRTEEKASFVLKMDMKGRQLYKYITNDILTPLGVKTENIYCTNLIKCFTTKMPEDKEKKEKGTIKGIADSCVDKLEYEINTIKPDLIISLSGTVFEYISSRYLNNRMQIKEHYGELFEINVQGNKYKYVPVIHLPKYKAVRDHYSGQAERLKKVKTELGSLEK